MENCGQSRRQPVRLQVRCWSTEPDATLESAAPDSPVLHWRLDEIAHSARELVRREGLLEELASFLQEATLDHIHTGVPGYEEDRKVWPALAHSAGELTPAHLRHDQIHNQQVYSAPFRFDDPESLDPVGSFQNRIACIPQRSGHDLADHRLIFDHHHELG